ncbi:hypothetical protein DPEC_G00317570 [Dallia pectoralis]|uniref:Uncharacterized protein n=1 Tax=Dallia pectoralis TaxID=75939 RepID=A0ACC2FD68_DALPE|nr:hypothetical protein DPEC_G00317570 [Dallia pectoralis]
MSLTGSPVTTFTTVSTNTTTTTKSKEQILTQSSGAMIAIIVVGIIIFLTIIFLILKTYNRQTHASRVLGAGSKRPKRQKTTSTSTIQTSMPMANLQASSVSGSFTQSNNVSGNGFQLPRVGLNPLEDGRMEQLSSTSDSTVVTIHDQPSFGNT